MKDKDFQELVESIRQAGAIRRGEARHSRITVVGEANVRGIRLHFKKTRAEFAKMVGVDAATVRDWELGNKKLEGPALALMLVAARNPNAVSEALASRS